MLVLRRPFAALALACAVLAALAALVLPAGAPADPSQDPSTALTTRGDRYVPKPAGTQESLKFWFGPYAVPAGWDANRVDIDLPLANGYIVSVEPGMRRVENLTEPTHQEAHIHHAHWFALDPGNQEDNYTGGNTEWIFGNGDEETKADFSERSAADPNGPIYGQFVGASGPQLMIYMLHNKTSAPLNVYIVLDVTFLHGTRDEVRAALGRDVHDVSGVLFGRTYDVERERTGDGEFNSTTDSPRGAIEWTSTVEGTMIGTGSHLHPGGLRVITENLGSEKNPCPKTGEATQGTHLLTSDALFRNALFSEDFQMEVTHPAWRAPIRKGDKLRITGIYENKDHAWYDVMTHQGVYIDEAQPPQGACEPYLAGGAKQRSVRWERYKHRHVVRVKVRSKARSKVRSKSRSRVRSKRRSVRANSRRSNRTRTVRKVKVHWHKRKVVEGIEVTAGVPNRPFHHHPDLFCGEKWGAAPCDRPEEARPPGRPTSTVSIANFLYVPGDYSLTGEAGAPAQVRKGESLTFVNLDQPANIRHSVTTCRWPCNGRYVANYPFPDGEWDSGTLGYDAVDGGSPNPVASTPPDLDVGRYAYFCRIHPWMRGSFEVVE